MSNKFVEHKGFNLVETNKEILDKWMKLDVFHKSIDEREVVHNSSSSRVLLRRTDTRASTTCLPVQSRTPSTDIRQ